MDQVTMLPRLGLCVLLLLSIWHGSHGTRVLRAGIQGQLPPCKDVPGGIPNSDCYDPPRTPLPPCDFKHHSPGIDCNTDGQKPPSPKVKLTVLDIAGAGGASTHNGVQGQLPPCKDVPGGIPNWDCYDPPRTPLPPCDFKHHSPGIDCNTDGQKPPSPKAKLTVLDIAGAGGASTHHGVQGQLPPCKDVPGGIPNWDCYDPPRTPLPPCDFKHHSPGIDCNFDGEKPPSPRAKLTVLDIAGAGGASTYHGVQGQLPPCKDVPGGIPNWDCYDPPRTPLPPCDFKHHSPGIDCNTDGQKPPSPKAKLTVLDIAGAGGASTHHGVQGQLPPCEDVPGGFPNWDCYDPPRTPLPPCDFKHHSLGIDCNTDGQKPPSPKAKLADISGAGAASTHAVIQGQLPPCKDVPGGIPNWDCYDPPRTPLPPCDFKHHSPGIDCNTDGQKPPSPKAKLTVLDIAGAGGASTHHGVQGQLPPCEDVPGGFPNWDCYDPPRTPLPPCDFKHHSPGIDCNTDGQKPPSPKAKLADISSAGAASTHAVIQGQLPPCKDVPGGIPNWDCYDPPRTPLPPCDFKHHSPGIDCNTDGQKPPSPKVKLAGALP